MKVILLSKTVKFSLFFSPKFELDMSASDESETKRQRTERIGRALLSRTRGYGKLILFGEVRDDRALLLGSFQSF